MSIALKLLCRVVRRRMAAGESLADILADYPRLTKDEMRQITAVLEG